MNLLIALLALASARADYFPDVSRPVPSLEAWRAGKASRIAVEASDVPGLSHEERVKMAAQFSSDLTKQFNALAAVQKPSSCVAPEASRYALALRALGKRDECAAYLAECGNASSFVALVGAQCASDRFDAPAAEAAFELATDARFAGSAEYPQAAFEYATYENFGPHPERVDAILARVPSWSAGDRALWKGVIRRAGLADLGALSKADVDKFLAARVADQTGNFHDYLLSLKISIAISDNHLTTALSDLAANSARFETPLHWYYHAYQASYYGFAEDFRLARQVYDAYDVFVDSWASLPSENNTYTYTEIYSTACKASVLAGSDLRAFNSFKADLRKGAVSFDAALAKAKALAEKFPAKADVLSAYAGLMSMAGRHEEAIAAYWKAHRACRYYNRANWGLTLEKRFRRYSAMPDYAANEGKVAAVVRGISVPAVTPQFVVNWKSLNQAERERVLYGSRIWTAFYELLSKNGSHVYIKAPFELLSESPGMSEVRDQRIEGDGHDTDHRLWDDVRGLGGETVIADANEVYQTAQGDYNLLGHEMTHQFHAYLSLKLSPLADCIENQFALASSRHVFPDAYSATNSKEFFAQGVTYYLVPAGSPERFGLNQSWLPANNPAQFRFIQSIDGAGGEIGKIRCLGE